MHCTPSPAVNVRMICPTCCPLVTLSTLRFVGGAGAAFLGASCLGASCATRGRKTNNSVTRTRIGLSYTGFGLANDLQHVRPVLQRGKDTLPDPALHRRRQCIELCAVDQIAKWIPEQPRAQIEIAQA